MATPKLRSILSLAATNTAVMCSQALPAMGSTMNPRKLRLRPHVVLTCTSQHQCLLSQQRHILRLVQLSAQLDMQDPRALVALYMQAPHGADLHVAAAAGVSCQQRWHVLWWMHASAHSCGVEMWPARSG